jgi:(5-formylfuran-3-yl)methyl phosphate transaminase
MTTTLARRTGLLEPFLAMEVMERAFALERKGAKVLHLEVGEPDLPPPPAAVEACAHALRGGQTRYTDSLGLPALREAIAADCRQRFDVAIDPECVIVTAGTSGAMLLVFSWLLDPGDEIIIGTPHFPCYPNLVRACGGRPIFVATDPVDGYRLDPDAVRAALTPRTRGILLNSPANPTGAVQSRETLEAIAALGVPIVSDEIYDGLVYDGARVASALHLDSEAYVLDGFSKRYAMTGFRLGWVVAPRAAVRGLQTLQQNLFISVSPFVQHAGIAALRDGAATPAAMRDSYAVRRVRLVEGLRALGFRVPALPEGALYVLADARRFDADSLRLAFALLERAHVGSAPGIDFGARAEGWLRFCFAVPEANIDLALERMARELPALTAR